MSRLLSLILLLIGCFAILSDLAAEEHRYRIGAIIPLSGQLASMGNYVHHGIELGLASLPPEQRARIEVVFEDDQFDPRKTLAAYQKLSLEKPLDAVIVVGSAPALALAPVTERNKEILIAVGASDPTVVKERRFTFTHWITPKMLGERLAQELLSRNFQRIAFLTTATAGAIADMDAAMEALWRKKADSRVIVNERFLQEQTDFRTTIAKLAAKNPDVVVLALAPGSLSSFVKQARELKLPGEIAGVETFENEAEVKAAEGALTGAWYVNASDPSDKFIRQYKESNGEYPGWASANGYDAITLLAQAVYANGEESEKIRNFLYDLKDFKGAAGQYSASGDGRFLLPPALKRVTEAGFVSIQSSQPRP